jgi:hypothetical protein
MLTSEEYKQLAQRCAELATECFEPTVAKALRALAWDYLARAESLRTRESVADKAINKP